MVFTVSTKTNWSKIPSNLKCIKIDVDCIEHLHKFSKVYEIHFLKVDVHVIGTECIMRNVQDSVIYEILCILSQRINKLILNKCFFSSKIFKQKQFPNITSLTVTEAQSSLKLSWFLKATSKNLKIIKADVCEKQIFKPSGTVFPKLRTITDLNTTLKPYYEIAQANKLYSIKFPQLINYITCINGKVCMNMYRNGKLYESNNEHILKTILHNRSKIKAIVAFQLCMKKILLAKDIVNLISAMIVNFNSLHWKPQDKYRVDDIVFRKDDVRLQSSLKILKEIEYIEFIMEIKENQIKKRKKLESQVLKMSEEIQEKRKKINEILF